MTNIPAWRQRMAPPHVLLAVVAVILAAAATFGVRGSLDNWRDGHWKKRSFLKIG